MISNTVAMATRKIVRKIIMASVGVFTIRKNVCEFNF